MQCLNQQDPTSITGTPHLVVPVPLQDSPRVTRPLCGSCCSSKIWITDSIDRRWPRMKFGMLYDVVDMSMTHRIRMYGIYANMTGVY